MGGDLWNDHYTASLAFDLVLDAIALVGRRLGGLDCQRLLIEQEVIAIKFVPERLFAGEARRGRLAGQAYSSKRQGEGHYGKWVQAISKVHKNEF